MYNISLVRDGLQGRQMTCVVVAGTTIYTEMTVIQVAGIYVAPHDHSRVPGSRYI